ncbi:nicotinate phosphoribosyltransferase [Marinobacter sp. NP-4(2019)]|uniref:nicotinate phosphoribosyltransferase n=1 Tax=Marinobacter sp. NP-4(2019) TaxID=2488665 RepID=UPI000FC3E2EE|nr:nicotinate phosphoribosyltransferase [Marinobacter sp. NP-4(2019)]AZT84735.1 nicotinate phosphoribosyltransferase [Marinobacter sp. NP-4(2019)]
MVHEKDLALLVDLYELAMAQAYWAEGMHDTAVFSLFFRDLPKNRNFILACGQQQVATVIETLKFSPEHIKRLESLDRFQPAFLEWLGRFRFSGHIRAVPEGTPLFPQEPLLEIEAPIAEAQILESLVMNYVHLETVLASKAVRVRLAAGERPVIDFGMRRMHGVDAAHRSVRAFRLAGLAGTSNVLAGLDYGLTVSGTMAHSFVQAYPDEMDAFKVYARLYPGTTLLVDTYDTRRAVRRIADWLKRDPDARVSAIRLDSGDLEAEARDCRAILDEAGLQDVRIMASGGLDEYRISRLVAAGAPIDGFGVGTAIGASNDAPALELAYKLTEYGGLPRMKNSSGKQSFPGGKQVFRQYDRDGRMKGDVISGREEVFDGDPLLRPLMKHGVVLLNAIDSLEQQAEHAAAAIRSLPPSYLKIEPAEPFPVVISRYLRALQADALKRVRG